MNEQEEQTQEENNKKGVLLKLSKDLDVEYIKAYDRLQRIGGFSPREIFIEGIKVCLNSERYKQEIKNLQEDPVTVQ